MVFPSEARGDRGQRQTRRENFVDLNKDGTRFRTRL